VFIARISRGRTIREFILGVVLSPTIFSVLWFAIFGGAAFEMENSGERAMAQPVQEDVTIALFALFDGLPLSTALAAVAAVLIFIFLVTSVDSATFVLSMMTSRGDMNPPRRQKLTWGIVLGAMGGALLLTDNYNSLRAVAVSGAIPFTFILLLQIAGFLRELRKENLGGG
jgi:glycine betaine transporter